MTHAGARTKLGLIYALKFEIYEIILIIINRDLEIHKFQNELS